MNLLAGASLLALAKSIYYNKGEGVGIRKQCTYGCLGVFTIYWFVYLLTLYLFVIKYAN